MGKVKVKRKEKILEVIEVQSKEKDLIFSPRFFLESIQ